MRISSSSLCEGKAREVPDLLGTRGAGALHEFRNGGREVNSVASSTRGEADLPGEQRLNRVGAHEGDYLEFSIPSTGSYLRLTNTARIHLTSLLAKGSLKEMPLDLLRQRWDGGIAGNSPGSRAKRLRGESGHVLPGRTRKWKTFNGLSFEWILGECVAAGIVELFETGTVGVGIRAR